VSDEPIEYLDLDDLLELAGMLLGGPVPIRDVGLLGSAAARPQTSVSGEDAYPDLTAKAAALLQSIVNHHALIDGNKRLGWLATAVFLELNGVRVSRAENEDVYELVMWIETDNPGVEEIIAGLERVIPIGRVSRAKGRRRPS
jgi:death-on-curing protein